MTDSWNSYPKIFAMGHRSIASILQEEVLVEEKLDGSQFSFGVFNGELRARSKGAKLVIDCPEKMFGAAIETIKELQPLLHDGWTYRGEYFQKPKHNTLAYQRIPNKHIIIFDIATGLEHYMTYTDKKIEAERIGLECVPKVYEGKIETNEQFKEFLDRQSVLGNQIIEGVVVKNHTRFGIDGKPMIGKFVSEYFKEVHTGEFRKQNPTNSDIIEKIIYQYQTPARWNKAIQHLRELGQLDESPADIGNLMKEINRDVLAECEAEIKDKLFTYAWAKISRGLTWGFPQWYKEQLLEKSFNEHKASTTNN